MGKEYFSPVSKKTNIEEMKNKENKKPLIEKESFNKKYFSVLKFLLLSFTILFFPLISFALPAITPNGLWVVKAAKCQNIQEGLLSRGLKCENNDSRLEIIQRYLINPSSNGIYDLDLKP